MTAVTPAVAPPARRTPEQRAALLVAALSSFLMPFMGTAVNIALPAIGREFRMNAQAQSWVPTAYLMTAAAFLLPTGRLADLYGRERILRFGLALVTAASLAMTVAPSERAFLVGRGLQGLGGEMIFCTNMALLISVFPASERGRVLGINVAFVYLGLSAGPPAGGVLVHQLGWRSVFVAMSLLAAAAWIIASRRLSGRPWAQPQEPYDWPGAALCIFSILCLIGGAQGARSGAGPALAVLGALALPAFLWVEWRTPHPLMDPRLFLRNPVFAFSNLAALIHYAATFAVGFFLSLYLQQVRGLTAEHAGLVLLAQPVVMAAFSPLAGRLSDRADARLVASAGMALTGLAVLALSLLSLETPFGWLIADLALMGLGFALFSSPNTNAVMGEIPAAQYGAASAILSAMRQLGMAISMALAGAIVAAYLGEGRLTPENYGPFIRCMGFAFPVYAGLCLVGLFASLARGRVNRADAPPDAPAAKPG